MYFVKNRAFLELGPSTIYNSSSFTYRNHDGRLQFVSMCYTTGHLREDGITYGIDIRGINDATANDISGDATCRR